MGVARSAGLLLAIAVGTPLAAPAGLVPFAAAQASLDLSALFPIARWSVARIPGRVEVDCIATYAAADGAVGYEITYATGARVGAFHFDWQGERQTVAYSLGPRTGSERSFRVSWADGDSAAEHTVVEQVGLDAAVAAIAAGAVDRPLAAVLEFVWADRFCLRSRVG